MEVPFICMKFDLFLYDWIDICGSLIYMYVRRLFLYGSIYFLLF